MKEACAKCGRERPEVIADPSCEHGGYCAWSPVVASYVCGVCKRVAKGTPSGGFNTPHGEVITCSGTCLLEGIKHAIPTTQEAMIANVLKNKQSN